MPHVAYVYRLYDAQGSLLYVGLTDNVRYRLAAHRRTKPWWHEVQRHEVTAFPNRSEAAAEELRLIASLSPKYNEAGTTSFVGGRPRSEPPPDLLARLRELAAAAEQIRPTALAALAAGGSVRVVAEAAGVSPTTVQKWKDAAS